MPQWTARVVRNSDNELVYGNQGDEEFKESFEFAMSTFDDATHTKTLEFLPTKEELREAEKDKVKDKNLNTKDRLEALIKYLGIEDI